MRTEVKLTKEQCKEVIALVNRGLELHNTTIDKVDRYLKEAYRSVVECYNNGADIMLDFKPIFMLSQALDRVVGYKSDLSKYIFAHITLTETKYAW